MPTTATSNIVPVDSVAASRSDSRQWELVQAFPLRPIRSDDQLEAAILAMKPLLGIDRSIDEDDYLHIIGNMIHEYKIEHHPMPEPTQGTSRAR